MRIETHTLESLGTDKYVEYYTEAFGTLTDHVPGQIFLCFDEDKRFAFFTGYQNGISTFYLQYIGFAKDVEISRKYNYYIDTLNEIHKMGFKYIMGTVSNLNHRALMYALKARFVIIGTRQATNGELFVEILRSN